MLHSCARKQRFSAKFVAMSIAMAMIALTLGWLTSPVSATGDEGGDECIPTETSDWRTSPPAGEGWEVIDTRTVTDQAAYDDESTEVLDYVQHYSLAGGSWTYDFAPKFPNTEDPNERIRWQANTQSEPHSSGNVTWVGTAGTGLHYTSNSGNGNSDWFYLEAIYKTVPGDHHGAVTHEEYKYQRTNECPPPTEEICEADFPQGEGTADDMWEITWGQQAGSNDAATFTMSSFGGLTSLNGGAVPGYMTDYGDGDDWTWLYVTRAQVEAGRTIDYGFADGTAIRAVVSGDEAGCPSVEWTTVPPDEEKPWICHPVNGKGELGNGWNLIQPAEPSRHIDEETYPKDGYWMHMSKDGLRHDRYAELKEGKDGTGGQDDYMCPGGELTEVSPMTIGTPDDCDPDLFGSITVTPMEGVTYKLQDGTVITGTIPANGTNTVTAHLDTDYTLAEDAQTVFGPFTSNPATDCPVLIDAPDKPAVTDPCGPSNIKWTDIPVDTETVAWTANQDGSLTAVPIAPAVFKGEAQSVRFTLPADSGEACPPNSTTISLPQPGVTDPCGAGNATWNVPGNANGLVWTVNDAGQLIVTITTPNTSFIESNNGLTSHNFGLPQETDIEDCELAGVQVEIPAEPGVKDPCGSDNARWKVPADTNKLDWTLTDGVLSVEITVPDTVFGGTQDTTYSFGKAAETNKKACEVKGEQGNNNNNNNNNPPPLTVEVKGEQAVSAAVPTAVDAGLGAENGPIPDGRNPLWLLVVGGGLGLMGSAGWRRRASTNR